MQAHVDGDLIGQTQALLSWGAGRTACLPGRVKLFADGATCSKVMQVTVPCTDGHKGEWIMEPALFDRAFDADLERDCRIRIHQNGEGGLDLVPDALQRGMQWLPRSDHRATVVQFGDARRDQVIRIRSLGAISSANPYRVTALSDRSAEIGLGPERADRLLPLSNAARATRPVSMHSDLPMVSGQPLFLVRAAANRTTTSGRVAGPDRRLGVERARRAVTIYAALSIRQEHEVGSIEPGEVANVTGLDADPFGVEPAAIKDIRVLATVADGRVFPVLPPDRRKSALAPPLRLAGRSGDPAPAIAARGLAQGCRCCQPVSTASCRGPALPASAVGCCRTSAPGWMVAALWSARMA